MMLLLKIYINKIVTTLLLAALTLTASAQGMIIDKTGVGSSKKEKSDTLTLDKTTYRVTYQSKSVRDTTEVPYKYRKDEMHLDISKAGLSKFYSYSKVLQEEFIKKQYAMGSFDLREMPKAGNLSWIFYKNYPAKGKTLMLDEVGGTDCYIEENAETPEWTVVPDSTAEILGYACQMAVTQFKGRQWTAWYTEDIPLDEGPWKLRGLPGLILKAYDAQRQFVFEGAGLEQIAEPVTFIKKKREKVSMKDFIKLRATYDPNDQIKGFSGKVVIVSSDGTKLDKIPKVKYNLIER